MEKLCLVVRIMPAGLRQTDIGYEQFKRLLKTFISLGIEIAMHCLNCACLHFLTYLYLLISRAKSCKSYTSKFRTAPSGFPATAWLSCFCFARAEQLMASLACPHQATLLPKTATNCCQKVKRQQIGNKLLPFRATILGNNLLPGVDRPLQ